MSAASSSTPTAPAGTNAVASETLIDAHTVLLVCPHCAKEFRGNRSTSGVRSNYRRHLLIHSGERPFACTFCQQGFTTKQNLVRHVRLVHRSLATPEAPAREPVAQQNRHDAAAESFTEPPPPLPELRLPPTTTSNAATTAAAAATSPSPASLAQLVEGATLPTAADAETASAAPSQSTSSTTQAGATATFTCGDCELELSSRGKLRRHQRYYCPFRDNVYADPVQDAVALYRRQHAPLRRGGYDSASADGRASDEGAEDVFAAPRHVRRRPLAPSRAARGGRGAAATMALTDEEKRYLVHAAERSGLKFVEDAYASDTDSDVASAASSASSCSTSTSSSERRLAVPRHGRPPPPARGSPPHTPRRTPVHGALLSPRLLPSGTPAHAARADGAEAEAEDDDGDATWTPEDLLHLQHHRRGSGRRRERHILQRRLRGQEGALMSLLTDSPGRPSRRRRREATTTDSSAEDDDDGDGSDDVRGPAPPRRSARVAAFVEPQASAPSPSTSAALLTPHVLAQAESLLTARWSDPGRGQGKSASAFACPYCDDYATFTSRRGLTAHMSRMHAEQVAKMRARAAATAEDDNVPPTP